VSKQKKSHTSLESVKRICEFVKLKMRAHHIEKKEFAEFICPSHLVDPQKRLKRTNLMEVLSTDPFELGSLSDKLQLCEYLFDS
jgi:hypothetical protein